MARLYVPLNVSYYNDPKIQEVGPAAELLYVRSLCWCRENTTDGTVTKQRLASVATGMRAPRALAARLVKVGLWHETPDAYAIPMAVWRRWNPTSEQVRTRREADNERKRAARIPPERPNGIRSESAHLSERIPSGPLPEPEPEPNACTLPAATAERDVRARRAAAAAAEGPTRIDPLTALGGPR